MKLTDIEELDAGDLAGPDYFDDLAETMDTWDDLPEPDIDYVDDGC